MMAPLEFMIEWKRMCNAQHNHCTECTLHIHDCDNMCVDPICMVEDATMEDIAHYVTEWSEAHPPVTNEMKLRQIFGDNVANSILALYPSDIKRWLAEPYKERK